MSTRKPSLKAVSTAAALLAVLALSACSSSKGVPQDATQGGSSLPVDTTLPTEATLPPVSAVGTVFEVVPETTQKPVEVVTRVQETGEVLATDLQLILLDAASYDKALKKYIGPGTVWSEGVVLASSITPSLIQGLSVPVGYTKEWRNDAGTYSILEDALVFKTAADASEYKARYIKLSRGSKVPEVPQSSTKVDYLAEYDTNETPFECRSIALTGTDRLVVMATVFHADCSVSTSVWSAMLADAAKQIAGLALNK